MKTTVRSGGTSHTKEGSTGIVRGEITEEEFAAEKQALEGQTVTSWSGLTALLKPIRWQMTGASLMSALASALQLAPAVAIAQIAINYSANRAFTASYTWRWLIIGAIGLVAGHFLNIAGTGYCHKLEAKYRRELRKRVAQKLTEVPLGWYDNHPSGDVKKIVRDDVEAIHTLVAHAPVDATAALALPIFSLIYLFIYNPLYAVGILVFLVLVVAVGGAMMGSMKDSTDHYLTAQARMSQSLVEMTDGIATVKNFGGDSPLFKRYEKALAYLSAWTERWMLASGKGQSLMVSLLTPAGMLVPVVVCGWLIVALTDAPSTILIPFFMVGLGLPTGLQSLISVFRFVSTGVEAAARIDTLLGVTPLPRAAHPTAIPAGPLGAELRGVTFGYDQARPVLDNVNITFPAGTVTALVGPSGSGKTTITRLIARFFDADEGAVLVGGINVKQVDEADLLSHLAIAEQDVSLTTDTVAANIALGRPEATREEIVEAAKGALIHERIMRLPDGYDTVLGEEDAHLSGGEKQRVTLARAFLRRAPLVLLDEATAYADPHSEREIQRALSRLAADRTVIVIAHRLPSIVGVDNIVVLDNGRVVEEGTHTELVGRGGLYSELWEAQQ